MLPPVLPLFHLKGYLNRLMIAIVALLFFSSTPYANIILNSAIESTLKRSCTESSRDFCHFLSHRMDDTPSTKNNKNLSNLQHISASRDDSTAEFRITNYFQTIQNNPKALYAFFKEMPKGGELHYHLAGGAYPETLLSLLAQQNYCLDPLTYTISKTNHCDGLPSSTLQQPKLYETTLRAWSLKHFVPLHETAHDHFYNSFYKFMVAEMDFRSFLLADIMRRAANQHELYLEILVLLDNARSTQFAAMLQQSKSWDEKRRILLSNPAFIQNVQQTIAAGDQLLQEVQQHLHCQTQSPDAECQVTVKFQYYVLREQPLNQVFAQALNGFMAAAQSNNIVGINLVQAEDGPISLRDYRQQMAIFAFLSRLYPQVHIALHAGELAPHTGTITKNDLRFHIHDALFIAHAERIGHGTDILHEDHAIAILNHMAKKNIPVEVNLTSNYKLLQSTAQNHPLQTYLQHHVPVVLSTDDEGILRTDLTAQYVNAVSKHHVDYATIKMINRNTLTYSFLPGVSLWQNATLAKLVPACKKLMSASCLDYIKQSPKARLQWQLEQQLIAFEKHHETLWQKTARQK